MVVGNTLSVLSLTEIIRYMFSTDRPPYPFVNFQDSVHASTERGKQLLAIEKDHLSHSTLLYPVQIILWSDAFAPSLFNDKSVHCLLATIGAREGDHSGNSTFPIWIGEAKYSTSKVERLLVDELNLLNKAQTKEGPFIVYHHPLKRMVQVKTCVFSFLCDRQDKGKRTGTMLGGLENLIYGYR